MSLLRPLPLKVTSMTQALLYTHLQKAPLGPCPLTPTAFPPREFFPPSLSPELSHIALCCHSSPPCPRLNPHPSLLPTPPQKPSTSTPPSRDPIHCCGFFLLHLCFLSGADIHTTPASSPLLAGSVKSMKKSKTYASVSFAPLCFWSARGVITVCISCCTQQCVFCNEAH